MALGFHPQFLKVVEALEREFPVSNWRCGDVEVWPLARMDLYLDMFWAESKFPRPRLRPAPLRALGRLATPGRNLWKSRRDLGHFVVKPRRAHAVFLGDGLSLDLIDGAWQDRFCEPLIAELERCGLGWFLMQGAELARLPWHRPTFSANILAAWGEWMAPFAPQVHLEQHSNLIRALHARGIVAPSLAYGPLRRRAQIVHATADAFEWVLRAVRPTLAFVVTFYAGLGAPFLVACRRRRVLSIDLQHCPQEGSHKAYGWWRVPERGYATLPAVFWTWTRKEADYIGDWTARLGRPWHSSLHGGHTQFASFAAQSASAEDRWFSAASHDTVEREILVALQPLGNGELWLALRRQIEAAPRSWRWWIRRHPGSSADQDREFEALLSLRLPNVMIEAASRLPLPALLRHMHALLSFASGAAVEAAAFGVPAYFLSREAAAPFSTLIARGEARIVDIADLMEVLRRAAPSGTSPDQWRAAPLAETLHRLTDMAHAYGRW
jgi:hypothetical protein